MPEQQKSGVEEVYYQGVYTFLEKILNEKYYSRTYERPTSLNLPQSLVLCHERRGYSL
jgi:hypothetical protein